MKNCLALKHLKKTFLVYKPLESDNLKFIFQLCHLPPVWPWASHLTSLSVGFFYKMLVWLLNLHSEKAMATHSSTLAWKIPWTEETGGLQSMGSRRVGHDWATSLSLFTSMHWKRKWQPTPVFLPGESQGWGSLVGCRFWDRTESDTTEATQQQQQQQAKTRRELL